MNLDTYLEDLSSIPDNCLKQFGRDLYRNLYIGNGDRGFRRDFEGNKVVFFDDRFDHAFFDKNDRGRKRVDIPSRIRLERIRWIESMINCEFDTECFEVPHDTNPEYEVKRLFVNWAKAYVVWVVPFGKIWKFSSAYRVESRGKIRRDYLRSGTKVFPKKGKAL